MNRFERYPVRTIVFGLFMSIVILDFLAANIYTLINGYPWAIMEKVQQEVKKKKIEKSYRVRSVVYNHDLAKNVCVNNARWGGLTYKICNNSLGFRDRVIRNVPLYASKYRILFIGDSFTEGLGFDYDYTFVGLIDEELSKKNIEVFNAAVNSYSPTIYWRKIKYLIENVGLEFNEVVVFLDLSDIEDEAIYYCLDEDGNVVRKNADNYKVKNIKEGDINFAGKIARNSKLLVKNNSILIYYALAKLRVMFKPELNYINEKKYDINFKKSLWTIDKDIYNEYGEKGLEKCGFYMDKLYNLLKANGISLTVAVYPWPVQVVADNLDSLQVLYWRKWCTTHNVHFIDYFPIFLTGKTKEEKENVLGRYFIKGDEHFNKNGHRLVAKLFLDYYRLRENNKAQPISFKENKKN